MNRIIPLLITMAPLLAACSTASPEPARLGEVGRRIETLGGSYTEITVDELSRLQQGDSEFLLVNTHIPFEGDIPHTDISIPYDEIDQQLAQLPADKDAPIVLYCRSDRMSTIAAERLVSLGYNAVYNVDGGMVAWEQAGYRLER